MALSGQHTLPVSLQGLLAAHRFRSLPLHASTTSYAETLALELRVPLVRLHEGAGGSVGGAAKGKGKSGGGSGGGGGPSAVYDRPRFESVAACLATVPVCTAAMGTVAGLPASRLVASHFAVMVRDGAVLTAGPKVVERALGYSVSKEELGGYDAVHADSGVVDNVAVSENDALRQIRRFLSCVEGVLAASTCSLAHVLLRSHRRTPLPLLALHLAPSRLYACSSHSYLPRSVRQLPPALPAPWQDAAPTAAVAAELAGIVPRRRRRGYDVRRLLALVVDEGSFFEIGTTRFGRGQVTGFARLRGRAVGVMANDCNVYAGAMSAEGAQKVLAMLLLLLLLLLLRAAPVFSSLIPLTCCAAKVTKFIELCATFHVPLVSFVDEPGFMIGVEAERAGTIRYGTRAVLTAQSCGLPWATVLVRVACG